MHMFCFIILMCWILKTKKKQSFDSTQNFQVEWVAKLPWAELQVGYNGYMHSMKGKNIL
jgi:hypothetical protein